MPDLSALTAADAPPLVVWAVVALALVKWITGRMHRLTRERITDADATIDRRDRELVALRALYDADVGALRARLAEADHRWTAHVARCPLYRTDP